MYYNALLAIISLEGTLFETPRFFQLKQKIHFYCKDSFPKVFYLAPIMIKTKKIKLSIVAQNSRIYVYRATLSTVYTTFKDDLCLLDTDE